MKWLNFGGGHHITRDDYDIETLIESILYMKNKYNVDIYLEPGEAVALNTGYLVSTVLDIVHNGIYLAGGGALLRGLDKRLTDKINIPFHVAEDPLLAVAKGTGVALKNVNRFQFLMR